MVSLYRKSLERKVNIKELVLQCPSQILLLSSTTIYLLAFFALFLQNSKFSIKLFYSCSLSSPEQNEKQKCQIHPFHTACHSYYGPLAELKQLLSCTSPNIMFQISQREISSPTRDIRITFKHLVLKLERFLS